MCGDRIDLLRIGLFDRSFRLAGGIPHRELRYACDFGRVGVRYQTPTATRTRWPCKSEIDARIVGNVAGTFWSALCIADYPQLRSARLLPIRVLLLARVLFRKGTERRRVRRT